ncbi:hypothetical protein H0H92_009579, partial [Tricholoma furcatifolium]
MAPSESPATVPLSTNTVNPSIVERAIKIQWVGTRFTQGTSDFLQWSRLLEDALCLNNLDNYVFEPTVSRPDPALEPRTHANWTRNNKIALTFLRSAIAETEHRELLVSGTARECYLDLKARSQREGP